MALRDAPKPLRRWISTFTYQPPHGSFGFGSRKQLENGISTASNLAEGGEYREFNQAVFRVLKDVEQVNHVRLNVSI